ncbi:MAG: hypothetical protein QOH37_3206 [Nocardioidaceae bacterium]|nr:hypothetical protein [Nocardioidaceae bacterium]
MSLATRQSAAGAVLSTSSRAVRLRGPLLTAGGVAAMTLALRLRDPHVSHSWGVCPLYYATGIYCPGCGSLRAVNDLTHGHLAAAASSNLLLVALIPVLGLLWASWTLVSWQGYDAHLVPRVPRAVTIALLVLVAAFVVARNLPGSWLAP